MGAQDRTRDNESGGAAAGAEQPLTTEEHRLVLDHQPWARDVVRRLAHRYQATLEEQDVNQLALEGLSRAARAFDPKWGVPFAGFAIKAVRGAVLNAGKVEKRFHGPLVRECLGWTDEGDRMEETEADALGKLYAKAGQAADAMIFSIVGMRSHEAATGGEDEALWAVLQSRIHDVLSSLPERPREAIVRRYLEEQELPDVAQSMGVSVSTVRRDCEEWLPRLGRRLAKAGVEDR